MKSIIFMLSLTLTLVLLIGGGIYYSVNNAGQEIKHLLAQDVEETTKTVSFNPQGTLSASTLNGSISITAHDEPILTITIIKKGHKEDFSFVTVEESLTKNQATFNCIYKKNNCNVSISYEIVLPKTATIIGKTTNGEIKVTEITGATSLQSINGSLHGMNTPHVLSAKTVNGSISLNTNLFSATVSTMQTTNGSIFFHADQLEAKIITLQSTNGSITAEVPSPLKTEGTNQNLSCTSGTTTIQASTINGSLSMRPIAKNK